MQRLKIDLIWQINSASNISEWSSWFMASDCNWSIQCKTGYINRKVGGSTPSSEILFLLFCFFLLLLERVWWGGFCVEVVRLCNFR